MTAAAALLNAPNDPRSFDRWTFDFSIQVSEINRAIQTQKNVFLPSYVLWPVPQSDIPNWLTRVQAALDQITATLGLENIDVESVNLTDDRARSAWSWSIFQEVYAARASLKI